MDGLLQTLIEIGFNHKEARVYYTLLQIGSNPASVIAKKAELNRSGCYPVLERLIERGFVQQIIKDNVTYFTAIEPASILDHLRTKYDELEIKIERLSHKLHDFEIMKNPYQGKSKAAFFQGEDGILNIMEDTLNSKETILAYAAFDELTDLFPHYFQKYSKRRVEKGISVKVLYPASLKSFLHKQRDQSELRESRLVPPKYNFHLDILIYDQKVAITSLKEKFGIVIENIEIAEAQKKIFNLMWISAKEYDFKISQSLAVKAATLQ